MQASVGVIEPRVYFFFLVSTTGRAIRAENPPVVYKPSLIFVRVFGQSNFDLQSSGGPLAYMRNNVLVSYSASSRGFIHEEGV